VITIIAQQTGAAFASFEILPLKIRIFNALVSYMKYVGKTFWPQDLTILYTYSYEDIPLWQTTGAALVLILVSGLAIRAVKRFPYVPFGWFWFLGTLIPVIGLVQVGSQPMADRYTYVPLIGLFIVVTWGLYAVIGKRRHGMAVVGVLSIIIIFALTMATWMQVSYWSNSIALFQRAVAISPDNAIVNNNLGFALARQGRFHEAIRYYNEALHLKPQYVTARFNLGLVMGKVGKPQDAIHNLTRVLHTEPDFPDAHYYLGVAFMQTNHFEKAKEHFQKALQLAPEYAEAHNELGILLARQGDLSQAKKHFSKAFAINPDFEQAKSNLEKASRRVRGN
jgi:Tfp pilus assembly protein PilF